MRTISRTPDPSTIVLHFTKPAHHAVVEQLATTAADMVSPTAVKTLGNEKIALAPVNAGSGPYVFKEWVHGDHLTVTRNPDYWGRKPYFDQVIFRVVPDAGARETMLRAGDVQFAFEPPAPDVPAMRKDGSLRVVEGASDRVIFIGMNNLYGPLKDVRVRQALNYAVNKQAIVHSVLFGLANVMDSPDTPAIFGYTRVQAGGWPFDPAPGRRRCSSRSWVSKRLYDRAPGRRPAATSRITKRRRRSRPNLQTSGRRSQVQTADWPSYIGALGVPPDRTQIQMYMLGQAGPYLDTDGELFGPLYSGMWPPNGYSSVFYKDPKFDQDLLAGQTTVNTTQRAAIYKDAQEVVWRDAPWIFLWSQGTSTS